MKDSKSLPEALCSKVFNTKEHSPYKHRCTYTLINLLLILNLLDSWMDYAIFTSRVANGFPLIEHSPWLE